jgi:flagellin
MRINTNVAALNSYNQLNNTQNNLQKSLQRLSSGKRINGAADDAAGLAISEKMNSQTKGLAMAQRNAQDGISMIQTAEGALKETHSILQRMRELAVQSANDTNTDADRAEIQKEVDQLATEINRIGETTEFNTQKLLDGSLTDIKFQIGANKDQSMEVSINNMQSKALGVDLGDISTSGTAIIDGVSGTTVATDSNLDNIAVDVGSGTWYSVGDVEDNGSGTLVAKADATELTTILDSGGTVIGFEEKAGINVSSQGAANNAISALDDAIASVSAERSKLGAVQNRLDHTINNLNTAEENLTAAESRISDVDMAKEMMSFTKNQILSQAGTAMLAQANQLPQGVLQLLG